MYRCAHCGFRVTDTYRQVKALIFIGKSKCENCDGDLKTREDFVRTET